MRRFGVLPVALLLLSLPTCARDEEAEVAKAARAYCAAVASGQHAVAWGLLTPETRDFWEEVSDALRHPGPLPAWDRYYLLPSGSESDPIRLMAESVAGPDAAQVSARELFARDLAGADRGLLRALSLQTPWVEVHGDEARAVWSRESTDAFLAWRSGAWRVDFLGQGGSTARRGPGRMLVRGPFGREFTYYTGLIFRDPPVQVLLPRLPGGPCDWIPDHCGVYAEAAGGRWVSREKAKDAEEFRALLLRYAERRRDDSDPSQPSEVVANLWFDRRLRWREAWEVVLEATEPEVRFRDLFVITRPGLLPDLLDPVGPFSFDMGIALRVTTISLRPKIKLFDPRVELAVGAGDVAAGLLARLPAAWAAVPPERKAEGLRLDLDDALPIEDALRAILAAAALHPARIALGGRAEVGTMVMPGTPPPLVLRLADAPLADPPPPAPWPWPIPLTIYWGERPAWAFDPR